MQTFESPGNTPDSSLGSSAPTVASSQALQLVLNDLQRLAELDLTTLMGLHRETMRLQPNTVEVYQGMADNLLRLGEPLIAYDVLSEALKKWPQDLQLQQSMALSLARSGAIISANLLLQQLVDAGQADEKTLGLLARTHKDLWSQASDRTQQQHHLTRAADCYERAYRLSHSHWTGINAATMALLRGHPNQAQTIAQTIYQQCQDRLGTQDATDDAYWLLATLGEAALILGAMDEAEDFYQRAIAIGQGRFGDISSSYRNAAMVVQHQGGDLSRVRLWFKLPRVAVFCGHMIDQPDRPTPRFPPALEDAVAQAIRDRLTQHNIHFGYASAACGADILFLEALLAAKGEIHIVLPYDKQQFIQDSVAIVPGGHWQQRFDAVMAQATEVVIASQHKPAHLDKVVYEYAHRLLHGLGKIRSAQLGTEFMPLALWNGLPGDGIGGTGSAVNYWQQWSGEVEIIDINALLQATPITLQAIEAPMPSVHPMIATSALERSRAPIPPKVLNQEIRAMLFADVVNFTQLREEQFPAFVHHFLGTVAQLSSTSAHAPLFQNTWGDSLYFVFATVQQAGIFSLELCGLIQQMQWQTHGLPPDLNLRIALHAGPVTRYRDPITGYTNYIGAHVNHTARMEPITPPGKVYASQAFAALASSEGVTAFTCDYVGKTPYAKQYGTFPTYHVRPCRAQILPLTAA